jgi:hypothetical protein
MTTDFDPKGVEIVAQGAALVPIGGQLPNLTEVRTKFN